MSKTISAIHDFIVAELAPAEHAPGKAPIAIVCEPLSVSGELMSDSSIFMRLLAGTTQDDGRTIASTLQTRIKRPGHLDASDAAAV